MKIDPATTKALLETLKSIGRGLYFGILGLVVLALVALSASPELLAMTITIGGLSINVGAAIAAGVALLAKTIDSYVHKNKSIDANGIAPNFLQK